MLVLGFQIIKTQKIKKNKINKRQLPTLLDLGFFKVKFKKILN